MGGKEITPLFINPRVSLKSDQGQISPCNINALIYETEWSK